jgi:hypothetical protein
MRINCWQFGLVDRTTSTEHAAPAAVAGTFEASGDGTMINSSTLVPLCVKRQLMILRCE